MRNPTHTGAVIARLLSERGRTTEWLSESTGLRSDTFNGPLSMLDAAMIADALNVNIATLISGNEEALTVAELARELKVSTDTVYRKAGKEIPGFKIAGAWRFYLSEVVAAGRPEKADPWAQPERARRSA